MEKRTRIKDQSESLDKLMELHREHPDYPIIPMVESEVVNDESCCYWMGRMGIVRIEKLLSGNREVHIYDPDPDELEMQDVLLDDGHIKSADMEKAEEDPKYAKELYDALKWQDCIVVYINTP